MAVSHATFLNLLLGIWEVKATQDLVSDIIPDQARSDPLIMDANLWLVQRTLNWSWSEAPLSPAPLSLGLPHRAPLI